MRLEWDATKSASNERKHGLSFDRAYLVFEDRRLTWLDDRYQLTEDRYVTVGTLDGVIVVVAHTDRGDRTRIISMRKANAREQARFRERLAE